MLRLVLSFKKLSRAILAFAVVLFCVAPNGLSAAYFSPAQDNAGSHLVATPANHTIRFKTPTGVDSPTDTITLDFTGFTLGAVGVSDVDLFHGPTGMEFLDAYAPVPAPGTWGVNIAGSVITFTPPTDAAPGTIAPNNLITIHIGTDVFGGTNQITNPAVAGEYKLTIAGNFGDGGQIAIPILDDDGVDVSATVISGAVTITNISPDSVAVSFPAFDLTVNGSSFAPDAVVRVNGSNRVTTYINANRLIAQVLASDVAVIGNQSITVLNPPAAISNTVILTVTAQSGGGGDITPPIISNVKAINITQNSARITWDTDENASSRVNYGETIAYGQSVSNNTLELSHGLDLSGLTANTTYHFKVTSADQYNNIISSADYTFTTLGVAPLVISNVTSTLITDTAALVVWDTDRPANSKVEYGPTPALGFWHTLLGDVVNHSMPLTGLSSETTYFYRVISTDPLGQLATSSIYSFNTQADKTPPTNVPFTAEAGDTVIRLRWNYPPEPDFAGIRITRKTGGFPTGPLDGAVIYNGLATSTLDMGLTNGVTYFYAAYAYDTHNNFSSGSLAFATPMGTLPLPPTSTPPIPPQPPTSTPPIPPQPPVIPTSTPPIPPQHPTSTPPIPPKPPLQIILHALYYSSNGTISLQPNENGVYGVLAGSSVYVYVPTANLGSTPQIGVMLVGSQAYSLALNGDGTAYTGTFLAPTSGLFTVDIRVTFQNGQISSVQDPFQIQPVGKVVEEPLIGGPVISVPGATVTLFENQNGAWVPWNSAPYGQSNPVISGPDGNFVFIVPNGQYYAEVKKDGYDLARTPAVQVKNNVFGNRVPLIKTPPPIQATTTFPFVANVPEQIQYVALIAKEIVRQPEVVTAVDNYAAPTLIAVSLINTSVALPLFSLFYYLQFLFTQPFLLFGRRKKKRWGVVYNSLSKQPVEFAVVRLVHFESKLIVQTRVTDKYGRFVFYPKPGSYLLEAEKPGYTFPTQYLDNQKEDGQYVGLYHGETIILEEDEVIDINIPLDPAASFETPKRVIYRYVLRKLQHLLALSGVIIAAISFIISPSWLIAAILIVQILFYLLFRKLALPAKSKPWGKVYDASTRKPIQGAVVRIFDHKFNKLLETQLTDDQGRYGFFADQNTFYITVERAGYNKFTTQDIDLVKISKDAVVDFNIALKPVKT
ncbi:MAG: fibronectin type III domain-containing protein [Patescibacteria group bacterium]|jgi:hypothetical protein